MDAPFLYIVRFWVSPSGQRAVLQWLDRGHMAEVIGQPGFLWVRRVELEQKADDDWAAFMMIYGLETRDALMRYFEGPAPAKFAKERQPFEAHLRMDRAWGTVDAQMP
jgi:hypothetical protein